MTDSEKRLQLFKELIEIVTEIGWNVALPNCDDEDEVPGMIIGTEAYVDRVTNAVDKAEKNG